MWENVLMLRYIYEKGQRFWAKIQDNCSLFLDATDEQKLTFNHVIWTLTLQALHSQMRSEP